MSINNSSAMHFTYIQLILLTININFLVFSLFIFKKNNGNKTANKILGTMLFLLVYINTHFVFLYDKQVYLAFPHIVGTHAPFLYLLPPLLFFFYKSVFDVSFIIKKVSLIHIVPAVLILLTYLPLYFSGVDYKLAFIKTGECYIPTLLLSGIFLLQFLVYLTLIFIDIRKNIDNVKGIKNMYLERYLLISQAITLLTFGILISVVMLRLNLIFIPILTSPIYYFVIYMVLVHPEVFYLCKFSKIEIAHKKYSTNELSNEFVNQTYQEIVQFIRQNKVYLNGKITLPDLAFQMKIPAHQMSQVINRKSQLNFNDFINKFRTEHCKNILLDEEYSHYTMEAIGELSGFKTRQTFIKSFKKFYHQTPSEFMKLKKQAV